MKTSLLFMLTVLTVLNCFAQDKTHFDKVIITYSKGYNPLGQHGVYAKSERLVLTTEGMKHYKAEHFEKIKHIGGNGAEASRDTTIVRLNYIIMPGRVDSLFANLITTKNNFNAVFVLPLLKPPAKARIRAVIKHSYNEEKLDKAFKYVKEISGFDQLNSFLNTIKPRPDGGILAVDSWNFLRVAFIKRSDTTSFYFDFANRVGQPFVREGKKPGESMGFVNLEANVLIKEMLPASSMAAKAIDIDNLTDDYIEWYSDRIH